jgi:hypothetical protein
MQNKSCYSDCPELTAQHELLDTSVNTHFFLVYKDYPASSYIITSTVQSFRNKLTVSYRVTHDDVKTAKFGVAPAWKSTSECHLY